MNTALKSNLPPTQISDILQNEGHTTIKYQVSITDDEGLPSMKIGDYHLSPDWRGVEWFVSWRGQGLDRPTNFLVRVI